MAEHSTAATSIHAGEGGIQDQVLLPNSIAFGICMRGIRTRLGRSVVTLLGVSLGITFLMAVISGFHVKTAMGKEAERMRITDRRVAILRGQIGALPRKPILVFAASPTAMDLRFIEALVTAQKARIKLAAPAGTEIPGVEKANLPADLPGRPGGCVTAVALGQYSSLPAFEQNLEALKGAALAVMAPPPAALQPRLQALDVRIKQLDVDLRLEEVREQQRRTAEARQRMWWIVGVSLLITVIGIANAMLMSVTERIREIGTMKCLGALSSFVVKLFLIESSLIGLVGSLLGALAGVLFSFVTYSYTFGALNILTSVSYPMLLLYGLASVVTGIILAIVAAIYPALLAARMIPAVALTSNV